MCSCLLSCTHTYVHYLQALNCSSTTWPLASVLPGSCKRAYIMIFTFRLPFQPLKNLSFTQVKHNKYLHICCEFLLGENENSLSLSECQYDDIRIMSWQVKTKPQWSSSVCHFGECWRAFRLVCRVDHVCGSCCFLYNMWTSSQQCFKWASAHWYTIPLLLDFTPWRNRTFYGIPGPLTSSRCPICPLLIRVSLGNS